MAPTMTIEEQHQVLFKFLETLERLFVCLLNYFLIVSFVFVVFFYMDQSESEMKVELT